MMDVKNLINVKDATQSRQVFWDREVYEKELENIFSRAWLFLTPENYIPNPGDFMTTYMGEDSVVVSRGPDGKIHAFANSCTHRGNKICVAERGNRRNFVCNYHGWAFSTDGSLVAVPLESNCFYNELDKSKLGCRQARVESYGGLVFGCWDPEAPSLRDYLGDMAWYLDTFLIGAGGGIELLGPPMKSRLKCNWKVPCENFVGDAYHVGWTHAGALQIIGGPLGGLAGNQADIPYEEMGLQFTTRHGHGLNLIDNAAYSVHEDNPGYAEFLEKTRAEVGRNLGPERERLYMGHLNGAIFPNTIFLYGTNTFKTVHPRGPHEFEVWTWTIVHKDMDPETKRQTQFNANRTFGSAGIFESEDGDNLVNVTFSNKGYVTRQGRMISSMGFSHEGPHPDYPGIVGSGFIGETGYRGFYLFWEEILNAPDWKSIRSKDQTWDSNWDERRDYWSQKLPEMEEAKK